MCRRQGRRAGAVSIRGGGQLGHPTASALAPDGSWLSLALGVGDACWGQWGQCHGHQEFGALVITGKGWAGAVEC